MNKYLAEFLGTYALVFAGTGAIVITALWIYLLAPIMGAIAAVPVLNILKPELKNTPK